MSITPDDYIDLDEPHTVHGMNGFPLLIGGVGVWPEEPWPKRRWLAYLAGARKFKLDEVDDGLLERFELTRAEFNEWRMDVAKVQARWRHVSEWAEANPDLAMQGLQIELPDDDET
jgi:hypothetical protein